MTARSASIEKKTAAVSVLAEPEVIPHDLERMQALIDALPCPALIMQLHRDSFTPLARNHHFERFSHARRTDPSFDFEKVMRSWLPNARAVALGERETLIFDLKYTGSLGPRSYRATLARVPTGADEPPMALFTAFDRTDETRIEAVLRRELLTDTLTALPNRTGFLEAVEAREASGGRGHAIVVVDLVRFSRINESLGPVAGDEIIITVARRIKSMLRSGDVLGRVGGNEFAILSADVQGMPDALQISSRVRHALESPIRIGSYLINVEAALGCAIDKDDSEDAEELFRRAQAAVKRSKKSGKFEVYRPSTLAEAQERFTLESRLREALQNNALDMQFQPFVSLASGEVVGFEALARWTDSELGVVPPGEFIPVAEESGLIVPLGRWALCESARRLAQWDASHGGEVPLTLNVNLSPVQISRDDVPAAVKDALHGAGIDGSRLTIELTESALIADLDRTRGLLDALKAMNLTIAMDDFGTGFSNLANLQTLPIDVLKIDRSFINGMVGDRDKIAIVRAILSLAGALSMKTVAEGIETAEVGRALADLGCDRGQGYFYARPMSADEAFAYWLERRSLASR